MNTKKLKNQPEPKIKTIKNHYGRECNDVFIYYYVLNKNGTYLFNIFAQK